MATEKEVARAALTAIAAVMACMQQDAIDYKIFQDLLMHNARLRYEQSIERGQRIRRRKEVLVLRHCRRGLHRIRPPSSQPCLPSKASAGRGFHSQATACAARCAGGPARARA